MHILLLWQYNSLRLVEVPSAGKQSIICNLFVEISIMYFSDAHSFPHILDILDLQAKMLCEVKGTGECWYSENNGKLL